MYNEKTIEKLKQRVLDLAIRGKLVPQDPSDEPASVLIEKIRKEKEKLIKEGKIKKPKKDSFIFKGSDNLYYENVNGKVKCIQDEIPFEIPESWVWCRLGNISEIIKGTSYKKEDIKKDGIRIIRGGNIYNYKLTFNDDDIFVDYKYINKTKQLKKNDIVIVSSTGSSNALGKPAFVAKDLEKTQIGAFIRIVRCCNIINSNYLFMIYQTLYYKTYIIKELTGTNINNLNSKYVLNMFVSIPPLKEQEKIINKYNGISNFIENIQKEYDNTNKIKKQLKNKVLNFIFSPNSSYKSYYENDFNLGDILEYEQPGPYIVKNTDYNDNFDIPVLTPGKTFILGYTDEKDGIYKATNDNKVIIFDDFTTASRLVDFNFKVKSSAMKILHISDESKFDIEYMYYLLQTINIIVDTHKRFWISEYAPLIVRIHTYDEQIRIKNKIKSVFETIDNL